MQNAYFQILRYFDYLVIDFSIGELEKPFQKLRDQGHEAVVRIVTGTTMIGAKGKGT